MTGATLPAAQRAITKAGIPLEIVRGEGYHYFIYDSPAANVFETESVMIPYTSDATPARWADLAQIAWEAIEKRLDDRA